MNPIIPIPKRALIMTCMFCISISLITCQMENLDGDIKLISSTDGKIIDEYSRIKVYSEDQNLVLSFHPEDFTKNFNRENSSQDGISIQKIDFSCQYDTLFSNVLWEIHPKDLDLSYPVSVTVYYTHEEFLPWHTDGDLKVFMLNRDYIDESYGDGEKRMFRFTDMTLVDNSIHHAGSLKVVAEIDAIGDIVLGMEPEAH